MNLPNFRQSPSLAAILRDLSTWSVTDINQAGKSKTVRNTYESNSNELYFQFKRQNLKLFVKLTIPMRPFIPTIQTLQLSEFPSSIPPQEITCAIQASTRMWSTNQITLLLHLRGNITLVFWFSDRQERWSRIDRFVYLINVTADQLLSENSPVQWRGAGWGMGAGRFSEDFWEHSNLCIKVSW